MIWPPYFLITYLLESHRSHVLSPYIIVTGAVGSDWHRYDPLPPDKCRPTAQSNLLSILTQYDLYIYIYFFLPFNNTNVVYLILPTLLSSEHECSQVGWPLASTWPDSVSKPTAKFNSRVIGFPNSRKEYCKQFKHLYCIQCLVDNLAYFGEFERRIFWKYIKR